MPRTRVAELEMEALVATSPARSMSIDNSDGNAVDNAEDVWAKENKGSLWDTEW